ncbi:unnamed protein product [Trichogramma brassicae]|uniref:Uncharacterized protein n=1 Tax=Trichogramma brassicae TaxID=86971 RepID=A0A6H5I5Y0_9HYME|nr:unnamed protein product [Trichogramma brassicae]
MFNNEINITIPGWEELRCECGAEVLLPPVRCGARAPACSAPCSRARACGHDVLHACHAGDCPPCVVLTTKRCHGGHEVRPDTNRLTNMDLLCYYSHPSILTRMEFHYRPNRPLSRSSCMIKTWCRICSEIRDSIYSEYDSLSNFCDKICTRRGSHVEISMPKFLMAWRLSIVISCNRFIAVNDLLLNIGQI